MEHGETEVILQFIRIQMTLQTTITWSTTCLGVLGEDIWQPVITRPTLLPMSLVMVQ